MSARKLKFAIFGNEYKKQEALPYIDRILKYLEAHDAEEVKRCLDAGARIVGVNNRNLKDFTVDITNSIRLRELVPSDITFVSESGIEKPEDVNILRENGTDAVLIGEMLMRSSDKQSLIQELKAR